MRHRVNLRKLHRTSSHRRAMFRNMTGSLVKHEIIKTTLAKAKELRRYVEPMITLAKNDSVANRRLAFDRLRDKETVGKLFNELGPRYEDRPGGYTRVLKCGFRDGDNAPMAIIELVDRALPEVPEFPMDEAAMAAPLMADAPEVDVIEGEATEVKEKATKEAKEEEMAKADDK